MLAGDVGEAGDLEQQGWTPVLGPNAETDTDINIGIL